MITANYIEAAVAFLREIISIPSYSFEEKEVSDFVCNYLNDKDVNIMRIKNNILCYHNWFDPDKASLLLNSHLDTVKESSNYSFDPFNPPHLDDKVLGLGSNDAGGSLTSLLFTFLHFKDKPLNVNPVLLFTVEEERSGESGMEFIAPHLGINRGHSAGIMDDIDNRALLESVRYAIIGEPTNMRAAVAERGLLVIDACANGVGGHAARGEGDNAIYISLSDIEKVRNFRFDKISPLMGEIKMAVTQIEGGNQHNVVPDKCNWVIDIRTTECYSNIEIVNILNKELESDLSPRNLNNRSSATPGDSPLLETLKALNIEQFISPTTSDWMRMGAIDCIKMGPGNSSRSHTADEYILVEEIRDGINGYISFIDTFSETVKHNKI